MNYPIHILTLTSIIGILALALDLVVGYTGLIFVGQAAFYGIGAYALAILMVNFHINFFLALILGVIVTMVVSLLIGLVLSKFKDDYYMLATLGFGVIIYQLFLNLDSVTHGALGMGGISRPTVFGYTFTDSFWFMIFCLVILTLIFILVRSISNSSFGRVLRAIREDEKAIQIFGYDTYVFKLVIFTVAAGIAGVAGGLYASYLSYISPFGFTLNLSIFILAAIILGGLASNRGALLGAFLLTILPEALRFAGFPSQTAAELQQISYGLLLTLFMLFRPKGILGNYKI